MSSSETRALLVAGVLIALATVARGTLLRDPPDDWRSNLRRAPADSLLAEGRARMRADARRRAPLRPGERIDPNRAAPEELDRLPGVGPALAQEIVHHRETHGPFLWADDLERVPGVGAATLERIRDRIALPPRPRPAAGGPPAGSGPGAPPPVLDLNRATAEELMRIPGIGPGRAARILAAREARRGFRTVDDLLEVPGIGPKTLTHLRPYLGVFP